MNLLSYPQSRPEFELLSELDEGLILNDKFKAVVQVEVIGKDASKVRLKISHVLIQEKKRMA
jgi:hypothetical protein